MILGNRCTRRCGFCAIETGRDEVEPDEPERVALAAEALGLRYAVVTSVARDDLADEGAEQFHRSIRALKERISGIDVEVLTPDFHARPELVTRVSEAGPAVYNHNLETVRRLQRLIRPQAAYERSLEVLRIVKRFFPEIAAKSGLMLGLGESEAEVLEAAQDLRDAGCEILTLGQYLPPSGRHAELREFIPPEVFEGLADKIKSMGVREVYAGSYVRSSYHAKERYEAESRWLR